MGNAVPGLPGSSQLQPRRGRGGGGGGRVRQGEVRALLASLHSGTSQWEGGGRERGAPHSPTAWHARPDSLRAAVIDRKDKMVLDGGLELPASLRGSVDACCAHGRLGW